MVIFLAGRDHIQPRQLHKRVKNRFQSDTDFGTVQLRISGPREPGSYRVDAETNPRRLLADDSYPVTDARIEVGFELGGQSGNDFYWFNWIEPDRNFLLGWHQDSDHSNLGPVHIQVNQNNTAINHESASFIDKHPIAVIDARLDQLPDALASVQWNNGTVTGLTSSSA
jgi:hypothetical protein